MAQEAEFQRARSGLEDLWQEQATAKKPEARERLSRDAIAVPLKVETEITSGVLRLLNKAAPPSPTVLQDALLPVLSPKPNGENRGVVAVLAFGDPRHPTYALAYNIASCAICSRSWLGILGGQEGGYSVLASVEDPHPNQAIDLAALSPPGKIAFLLYGTNWGDAHNRLNATVYHFDGKKLDPIWSKSGLAQGSIRLVAGGFVLSYLTPLAPPWRRITETYAVLPGAVVLQSRSEVPEH